MCLFAVWLRSNDSASFSMWRFNLIFYKCWKHSSIVLVQSALSKNSLLLEINSFLLAAARRNNKPCLEEVQACVSSSDLILILDIAPIKISPFRSRASVLFEWVTVVHTATQQVVILLLFYVLPSYFCNWIPTQKLNSIYLHIASSCVLESDNPHRSEFTFCVPKFARERRGV